MQPAHLAAGRLLLRTHGPLTMGRRHKLRTGQTVAGSNSVKALSTSTHAQGIQAARWHSRDGWHMLQAEQAVRRVLDNLCECGHLAQVNRLLAAFDTDFNFAPPTANMCRVLEHVSWPCHVMSRHAWLLLAKQGRDLRDESLHSSNNVATSYVGRWYPYKGTI